MVFILRAAMTLSLYPGIFQFQQLKGINSLWPIGHQWNGSALVQVMACTCLVSNHFLKQCWLIGYCTLRNKFHKKSQKKKRDLFWVKKNAFENAICKVSAILSKQQCVSDTKPRRHYLHHHASAGSWDVVLSNFRIVLYCQLETRLWLLQKKNP